MISIDISSTNIFQLISRLYWNWTMQNCDWIVLIHLRIIYRSFQFDLQSVAQKDIMVFKYEERHCNDNLKINFSHITIPNEYIWTDPFRMWIFGWNCDFLQFNSIICLKWSCEVIQIKNTISQFKRPFRNSIYEMMLNRM